jgi:hypothetical protein
VSTRKMSTYRRLELAAGLRRSILIRKMPRSGWSKDQSGYNPMSNGESSTRTGRFGRRLKAFAAIEIGIIPEFAGVPVKMVIDRVFDVDGQLVVVDLKTSQRTPDSSLQLGFYRAGLKKVFGIDVNYGSYWMSRQSGTSEMVDLTKYSTDMIDYFVEKFDKARRDGYILTKHKQL